MFIGNPDPGSRRRIDFIAIEDHRGGGFVSPCITQRVYCLCYGCGQLAIRCHYRTRAVIDPVRRPLGRWDLSLLTSSVIAAVALRTCSRHAHVIAVLFGHVTGLALALVGDAVVRAKPAATGSTAALDVTDSDICRSHYRHHHKANMRKSLALTRGAIRTHAQSQ